MYFSLIDDIKISMAVAKANAMIKQEQKRDRGRSQTGGNKTTDDNEKPFRECPVSDVNIPENVPPQASADTKKYELIAKGLIERAQTFIGKDNLSKEDREECEEIYGGFMQLLKIHGYKGNREFHDTYAALRGVINVIDEMEEIRLKKD